MPRKALWRRSEYDRRIYGLNGVEKTEIELALRRLGYVLRIRLPEGSADKLVDLGYVERCEKKHLSLTDAGRALAYELAKRKAYARSFRDYGRTGEMTVVNIPKYFQRAV